MRSCVSRGLLTLGSHLEFLRAVGAPASCCYDCKLGSGSIDLLEVALAACFKLPN